MVGILYQARFDSLFIQSPKYKTYYCCPIKLLDKEKNLQISREHGEERYIKRFDGWTHLVVMLYAVIESVFEAIYRDLYATYLSRLSSDSNNLLTKNAPPPNSRRRCAQHKYFLIA